MHVEKKWQISGNGMLSCSWEYVVCGVVLYNCVVVGCLLATLLMLFALSLSRLICWLCVCAPGFVGQCLNDLLSGCTRICHANVQMICCPPGRAHDPVRFVKPVSNWLASGFSGLQAKANLSQHTCVDPTVGPITEYSRFYVKGYVNFVDEAR